MLILTLVLYYIVACSIIPGESQRRALVDYSLPTTEQHRPLSGPSPRNNGAVDISTAEVPKRYQVRPVSNSDDAGKSSSSVNTDRSKVSTEYRGAVISGTDPHPNSPLHTASGRTSTPQTNANRRQDFVHRDRHEEETKNADRGTSYSTNSDVVRPVRRTAGDIRIPSPVRKSEISSDRNSDRSERPVTSAHENGNEKKFNQPGLASSSETSEIDEHRFVANERFPKDQNERGSSTSYDERRGNDKRISSETRYAEEAYRSSRGDVRVSGLDERHAKRKETTDIDSKLLREGNRGEVTESGNLDGSPQRSITRDSYDRTHEVETHESRYRGNSDDKKLHKGDGDSYSDRHRITMGDDANKGIPSERHISQSSKDSGTNRGVTLDDDYRQKGSSDHMDWDKGNRDSHDATRRVRQDDYRPNVSLGDKKLSKGSRDSFDHNHRVDDYRRAVTSDNGKSEKGDRDSDDERYEVVVDDRRHIDSSDDRNLDKGDRGSYNDRRRATVDDNNRRTSSDGRKVNEGNRDSYDDRRRDTAEGHGHEGSSDNKDFPKSSRDLYSDRHKVEIDEDRYRGSSDDRHLDKGGRDSYDDRHLDKGGRDSYDDRHLDKGGRDSYDDRRRDIVEDRSHKSSSDSKEFDRSSSDTHSDRHKVETDEHRYGGSSDDRHSNKGGRDSYDHIRRADVDDYRHKGSSDDEKLENADKDSYDGKHSATVDDYRNEGRLDDRKFGKGDREPYDDRHKVTVDDHRYESSSDGISLDKGDRYSHDGRHKTREDDRGHKIISDDRGLDKSDRDSFPDRHKATVDDHRRRDNSNSRNLNRGNRNSYGDAHRPAEEVHRYKDGMDDRKLGEGGRHQDSVDDYIHESSSDGTKFDEGRRGSHDDRHKITVDDHRFESSSDGRNSDKGDRNSYDSRHKAREDHSSTHDRSFDTERMHEKDGKVVSKEGRRFRSEETLETRDRADDRRNPELKGELYDPDKRAAETLFQTESKSSETVELSASSPDSHKASENSRQHGSDYTANRPKDKSGDEMQNRPLSRSEHDDSFRPNQRGEKGPVLSPNLRDTIISRDEDGLNPREGYPITSNTRQPKPDESRYRSPQRPLRASSDVHGSTRSSIHDPPAPHRSSADHNRERHRGGGDWHNPTEDDPIIVRNQDMAKGDNGTERSQLAKSSRSNEERTTQNERGYRSSSGETSSYLKAEKSVRTIETSRNAEKSDEERITATDRLSGSATRSEGSPVYSELLEDTSLASNRRENKDDVSPLPPSSRSSERGHESRGNYSPTSNNNPPPRRHSARGDELPILSSDTQQFVNKHRSPERPEVSNGSLSDESRNLERTEGRVISTPNASPQGPRNRPILNQPTNRNPVFNPNNPRTPSTSTVPGNPHRKPLSPSEVIEASYRDTDTNRQKDVHYPVFDPNVHNMTSPGIIRINEMRGILITTRRKRKW